MACLILAKHIAVRRRSNFNTATFCGICQQMSRKNGGIRWVVALSRGHSSMHRGFQKWEQPWKRFRSSLTRTKFTKCGIGVTLAILDVKRERCIIYTLVLIQRCLKMLRDKLHLASLRRWLLCRSRDGIRTAREMLNVLADYYFQQDTSWTRSWEMNVCKLYQIVIEKLFSGFHLSRNWFQWLLTSKFQAPSVDPRVTEYAWVSVLDISHQRVCNFRRFKAHWPSFWKNEVAGLGERFNDADGGIDL